MSCDYIRLCGTGVVSCFVQEEIYCSSYSAAAYLDSIGFDRSKKVRDHDRQSQGRKQVVESVMRFRVLLMHLQIGFCCWVLGLSEDVVWCIGLPIPTCAKQLGILHPHVSSRAPYLASCLHTPSTTLLWRPSFLCVPPPLLPPISQTTTPGLRCW
jgi:hypothetical protein